MENEKNQQTDSTIPSQLDAKTNNLKLSYFSLALIILLCSALFGLSGFYLGKQITPVPIKNQRTHGARPTSAPTIKPTSLPSATPNQPNITKKSDKDEAKTENTFLINNSGKDMDYQTNPPLDLKVTIPKDSQYQLEKGDNDEDWSILIKTPTGLSVGMCTGCIQYSKCDIDGVECSTKKINIGDLPFTVRTYKNDPLKLADVMGWLKNIDDVAVKIESEDNRQLTESDIETVSQLLQSIK